LNHVSFSSEAGATRITSRWHPTRCCFSGVVFQTKTHTVLQLIRKLLQLEVKKAHSCHSSVPSWHPRCSHSVNFPQEGGLCQVWCCKTHHMGCAFDCRDHLSTWQAGSPVSSVLFKPTVGPWGMEG
jgi:hypothetical protein